MFHYKFYYKLGIYEGSMSYTDIVKNTSHISEKDILKKVKVNDIFTPFKEALNNSLEAIKCKNPKNDEYKDARISVNIFVKKDSANELRLDYIEIKDNGSGFTEKGFERFCRYMDISKGFNNKGTGRFYLIKAFNKALYKSTCKLKNEFYNVEFNFSASNPAVDMFIHIIKEEKSQIGSIGTTLILYPHEEEYTKYNLFLDLEKLKQKVLETFLPEFLLHLKTSIPQISFTKYISNKISDSFSIDKNIIPSIDKDQNITVPLYKANFETKTLDKTQEKINIRLYTARSPIIKRNEIVLTSANQKVEAINFQDLLPSDVLDNDKIALFVKSKYLDKEEYVDNERRKFNFYKKSELEKILKKDEKQGDFGFSNEIYLVRDELEKQINKKFSQMYPNVKKIKSEKDIELQKLKKRFLISDEIFDKVTKKLSINASSDEIFTEFYKAEAEVLAQRDIEISKKIDAVISIDTSSKNCMQELDKLSEEIVKLLPLQNRNSLVQYVARRKLVLKAFKGILDNSPNPAIKEANFHNLFLTKGEDNTYNNSNLWMLSEDFIYYSGKSEEQLCNFKLNNENVFNSEFSAEEERYLLSLGENRKIKRPDILLFPQENKCIIIEFKNVEVNVSDHLNQINKYAYFLRNFTNEKFQFKQFYGYLIGEPIECEDVRAADSDFKSFHDGKGMFRPKKNVVCKNNQNADGELYMEVLPYTELLEKATLRNRIFIEKLGIQDKDN